MNALEAVGSGTEMNSQAAQADGIIAFHGRNINFYHFMSNNAL